MKKTTLLFALFVLFVTQITATKAQVIITPETQSQAVKAIEKEKSAEKSSEISSAVARAARFWQAQDGTPEDFINLCKENYITGDTTPTFLRIDKNLEAIAGHNAEISRIINEPLQLEINPILPIDRQFGEYSPSAHLTDDMFKTKIAFTILLNFPPYSLSQKNTNGMDRSRIEWAKMRLGDYFDSRVPAEIKQDINKRYVAADAYISEYNIYMNNILTPEGKRLFPKGMKLISHWGLRDELRSQYKNTDGLEKQKIIQKIMERIISQEIPAQVINSDKYDWEPFANKLYKDGKEVSFASENGKRYQVLKSIFEGALKADPYYPQNPTLIERKFNQELEISEKEVEDLLMSVISSPLIKKTGKLIEKETGRKPLPFDIWYTGFEPKAKISENELDAIVSRKYPTAEAFQKDIPNILVKLGFEPEKAKFIASRITVDPARGAGHAMGPESKEFNAHLRTRFNNGKMNYKSYNIAIHELGHCVEQVISNILIDYKMLAGVPNTAFTEAFAFLFQSRDLELLGIKEAGVSGSKDASLETMWKVYEIGGVSLVAMKTWRWMYAHPQATDKELQDAVIQISKDLWNKYYEPVLGQKDCTLLAVYSHMIDYDLYLPNYPIGHIIRYQIEDQIKNKNLSSEMTRMCLLGRVTPEIWIKKATGKGISTNSILINADKILQQELK